MQDLISRQKAIEAVSRGCQEFRGIFAECEKNLNELPPAQPERKKGKWIKTGQSFVFPEKFRNYSCSECRYDINKTKFNFCPNCGANMRE